MCLRQREETARESYTQCQSPINTGDTTLSLHPLCVCIHTHTHRGIQNTKQIDTALTHACNSRMHTAALFEDTLIGRLVRIQQTQRAETLQQQESGSVVKV